MAAVNCPLCELRFANRNERDWHLRNEHEHLHLHPPTEKPVLWWRHRRPGADREIGRRDEEHPTGADPAG